MRILNSPRSGAILLLIGGKANTVIAVVRYVSRYG
jgi:hypothetical protein